MEYKKLGRYELRSVLGKGAMGVVYEGFDPSLGRRVAVKTILKSVGLDPETEAAYSARFIQEAKAVARLNHPNIVQVHDFGVENDIAYLVMEFIQGRELRSYFSAGERFEVAECVRLMGELLDALDFAHEAGVIHRDIKPANVMLDGQRRAKLTDFGVARIQDSERSAAGTMVGTPAFMSPEQISGGKIDRRTDIFSAGTVLYQLLTGEQPFKGEGAWTVAKQIMQDEPPAPSSVVVSVSPAFDAIVNKALAKKPAERFASAHEFAAALRGAIGAAAQAATGISPKPKTRAETKASETEIEFWRALQNSNDPDEFALYIEQFHDGAYAQLARIKLAKLNAPLEAARRAAEEKARVEAEGRAKCEADERAIQEALEKTKRDAAEKAKREAEEEARRVQVLAKLKQQEEAAARAKAKAADAEATVAVGKAAPAPERPAQEKRSFVAPAVIGVAVAVVGVAAYLISSRTPAPVPVAEAPAVPTVGAPAPVPAAAPPAPAKPEVPAAEIEKIKKEAEDRVRREFSDKAAAKATSEKAAAEKAAESARRAAEAVAAAKSAQEKAAMEKTAAIERAAAERAVAAERAAVAAERAAAERVAAAEKASKAAAAKAAEEKAAEEKAAALKAPAPSVAAPATPNREGMIPGRYELRVSTGAGFVQECDRLGFQENVELGTATSKSVSGRDFADLQFRSSPDGSVAGSAWGIGASRFGGGGQYSFTGRGNSAGYAGNYVWRGGSSVCTGNWTLVRK